MYVKHEPQALQTYLNHMEQYMQNLQCRLSY